MAKVKIFFDIDSNIANDFATYAIAKGWFALTENDNFLWIL